MLYPLPPCIPGTLMRSSEEGRAQSSHLTAARTSRCAGAGNLWAEVKELAVPNGYVTLGAVGYVSLHPREARSPGLPERATWSHCHTSSCPAAGRHVLSGKECACACQQVPCLFQARRASKHSISQITISQPRIIVLVHKVAGRQGMLAE